MYGNSSISAFLQTNFVMASDMMQADFIVRFVLTFRKIISVTGFSNLKYVIGH